ncbi:MAG: SLOG family protein [Alphaproteobacteria bacterium]|nr:SLOG family protein [Alphaproteobacteria bacterium]
MKRIIAGGRRYGTKLGHEHYEFCPDDVSLLDQVAENFDIAEVVSGRCKGADLCGESWAESRGIPVKPFPAEWDKDSTANDPNGKRAAYVRNLAMVRYADAVALFPGGKGTGMIEAIAKAHIIRISDCRPHIDRRRARR